MAKYILLFTLVIAEYSFSGEILPALASYEYIQKKRQEAEAYWAKEELNEQDIYKGIGILKDSLEYLDNPSVIALAEGNIHLKFRRSDVHREIAEAYARLGNAEKAVRHLYNVIEVGNRPWLYGYFKESDAFYKIKDSGSFNAFLNYIENLNNMSNNAALTKPYSIDIPLSEKIAGISLLWSTVKNYFVYFEQVPALDWDAEYLKAIQRVLETKSTVEYYKELIKFSALLNDSHTNVYFPKSLWPKFYSRPPIETELIDGKVIITAIKSESLAKEFVIGSEITLINDVPVHEYVENNITPFVSASTPQDRNVREYSYELLMGDEDSLATFTATSPSGMTSTHKIKRKGYNDLQKKDDVKIEYFDNIAYLRISSFTSNLATKMFDQNFPDIQQSKGLIIDVRNNGGGSSEWSLLKRISKQPFKTTAFQVRVSNGQDIANNQAFFDWSTLTYSEIEGSGKNAFTKPVIVLTNAKTFSAAEDFVAAFKQSNRGIIIGETTAGSTGQPLLVKLPGGGTARVCVKKDSFFNGDSFVGKGIIPDIEVKRNILSVINSVDEPLLKARQYINTLHEKTQR